MEDICMCILPIFAFCLLGFAQPPERAVAQGSSWLPPPPTTAKSSACRHGLDAQKEAEQYISV